MRKSLQKTPPSGLSSELAPVRAGLLAVGARRHAPKRGARANGANGRVASGARSAQAFAANLRLLEGFISRTDVADCAQHALQWLGEVFGIERAICLARPAGEPVMTTVGVHGLPYEATTFSVSVDDWTNPLIAALNQPHTFFASAHSTADRRHHRPETPFDAAAFHAIPLGLRSDLSDSGALGLLLVAGGDRAFPDLQWFSNVFGQKLDHL